MSSIFTLYHGGGASGWSSGELAFPAAKSAKLFEACAKLLSHSAEAQAVLISGNFELRHGINDFCDEFFVLTKKVSLDDFLQFQDEAQLSGRDPAYSMIARAFRSLGLHVRFIGVELTLDDDVPPVESPNISTVTASAVAAALSDAETLIVSGNFVGAIDRVHTALHGYARSLCIEAQIVAPGEPVELPRAIKLLRESHPNLKAEGPHSAQIEKVLKGIGMICDTMGTLRNHGSLAHPNELLLGQPEALLVANTARTILRFLNDKIEEAAQ